MQMSKGNILVFAQNVPLTIQITNQCYYVLYYEALAQHAFTPAFEGLLGPCEQNAMICSFQLGMGKYSR